jgi:hypothetical protein
MTPITEQHRKAAAEVAAELHWRFNLTTTSADVIAAILARWWPARNIEVKESPFTEQQKQAIIYALKNGTAPARGRRKG